MKFIPLLLALSILLAACQPGTPPDQTLPTLAVLPSASPSTTPEDILATETLEPELEASSTSVTESIPSDVPSQTITLTKTLRPVTATATVEPTQAAIGTATQAILEAPRYSTFTPAPNGSTGDVANVVADITVSEIQFQEEIDRNILAYSSMQSAAVDFIDGAINVRMTLAADNGPSITGVVTIPVTLNGDLAQITISAITTEQETTPQAFIDVATSDLFILMLNTLDQIVKQRVGPQQKLKSITVTNANITLALIVPQ